MKNIFVFAALLAVACTKKNQTFIPEVRSVTYLHHYIDEKNFRYRTDTAIHWCEVSGEELKRFQAAQKMESYCDNDDLLELRIEKACKP